MYTLSTSRAESEDSDWPVAMIQLWRIIYIGNLIFSDYKTVNNALITWRMSISCEFKKEIVQIS